MREKHSFCPSFDSSTRGNSPKFLLADDMLNIFMEAMRAGEKFLNWGSIKSVKISRRACHAIFKKIIFRASGELLSQKLLFRLTPSLNCFTQHRLFCNCAILI